LTPFWPILTKQQASLSSGRRTLGSDKTALLSPL
jgi:hypothetical protein